MLFTQLVIIEFSPAVTVALELFFAHCCLLELVSQISCGISSDIAFIPASSTRTMVFPVAHAFPAPEMATTLAMSSHLVTARTPLNLLATLGAGLGVGNDPVHVLALRTILSFPLLHSFAGNRPVRVL
jgi:hypothetical protein